MIRKYTSKGGYRRGEYYKVLWMMMAGSAAATASAAATN